MTTESNHAELESRLNSLVRQRKTDQAFDELAAAIASAPLDERLYFFKATLCLEVGDTQDAIANVQKTLYLNPDNASAHYLLGVLMLQMGQEVKGRKHLEHFLLTVSGSNPVDAAEDDAPDISPNLLVESIRGLFARSPNASRKINE